MVTPCFYFRFIPGKPCMPLLSQCFPSCTKSVWSFISHLSSRPLEADVLAMAQCFLTWLKFILVTLPLLPWTHGPDGFRLGDLRRWHSFSSEHEDWDMFWGKFCASPPHREGSWSVKFNIVHCLFHFKVNVKLALSLPSRSCMATWVLHSHTRGIQLSRTGNESRYASIGYEKHVHTNVPHTLQTQPPSAASLTLKDAFYKV